MWATTPKYARFGPSVILSPTLNPLKGESESSVMMWVAGREPPRAFAAAVIVGPVEDAVVEFQFCHRGSALRTHGDLIAKS
jgi:hypothetical protein